MGKAFDGQRANAEVNFYLDDPRMVQLPAGAKWLHWVLNMLCVRARRCTLPPRFSLRYLSTTATLHRSTTQIHLQRLAQDCTIKIWPDGSITVYGVKELNPKIGWKDDYPTEVECESNGSHSKSSFANGIAIAIAPLRGDCDSKEPAPSARLLEVEEQLPENPSTHFNYEGVLLGKLRAAWQLRFGGIQHPNMKIFLTRCRARDISPLTVFNYAKAHQPDDPLKYVQSLVRQGDGLWPDNGDESYAKWENGALGSECGKVGT